jgi:hypothetical protein
MNSSPVAAKRHRLSKADKESLLERLAKLRDETESLRLFSVSEIIDEAIVALRRKKSF